MSPDFDFDLLNEMVNEAPTVGFGPQRNFGKLVGTITFVKYNQSTNKYEERPFDNKPAKQGEWIRLTLNSDLSEFNPQLTNPYKRQVDVKKSNKTGNKDKWTLTDWSETVEPAFLSLLGKDYWKKILKGVYAEWEDVDTVEKNKEGKLKGFFKKDRETREVTDQWLTNTVTHLVTVFKSKAECEAARAERYTKKDADMSFGDDGDIPADILTNVRGLISSVGEDQARTMLEENKPFGDYEADDLINAAKK